MKKLTILMLCIATLGLASCKKETIYQELRAKTYNFTINANEWQRNANGSYSVNKSLAAIDGITLDDEGILVYFEHPVEVPTGDIQLPYTYNYNAFSYKVYSGGLRFDVQDTNNLTSTVPPNYNTLVKVVIIPSDYAGN
ncbi:hypothetical protein [Pedobacter agri]|uniref:hypothetical protein n=1 Tax=Pedobacter agri TaxID=454586 RepID=UPI0029302740|nr:hypothetical protein [Pedobacter agri]